MGVGGVLDDAQAVAPGHLQEGVHLARHAPAVHHHDGPGAGRDPALLLGACGGAPSAGSGGDVPRQSTAPLTITAQLTDVNPTMANSWATEIAARTSSATPT